MGMRHRRAVGLLLAACVASGCAATSEGPRPGATPGWPIPANPSARRVFYEDYESGTCERIQKDSAAAVVSAADGADVAAGKYCLRGNFDPETTDPITHIKAINKSTKLRDIPLVDTSVRDELYISLLWRLDPGTTFQVDRAGPGAAASFKLAYIVGTGNPWAENVNVVPLQTGDPSGWAIANNIPNPKQTSFKAIGRVDDAAAQTGAWHRVEIYLKLESVPGAGDGIGIIRVDGQTCIDRRDLIYLWKGGQPQHWGRLWIPSMFGGAFPPKHSFGWQMDELQIWDGLPPSQPAR